MSKYEMVVGLEVHAELKTKTKIFCSCKTDFGAEPNTRVCPVCLGHPGALPSLNYNAVKLAIRAGLMTGCSISPRTHLDRKHYFYPDLPKAYQISQDSSPLCTGGNVGRVKIKRIHIEEDAGKLIHIGGLSLIDYNRCGVPLIEIVSEPFVSTPEDAVNYLKELRDLLRYADVSDCKMQEGSMRCDVNVSLRKIGDTALGMRCEIKNINSFSFVAEALRYEFLRQSKLLDDGITIMQETRRYDEASGKTVLMRIKETAEDYRYIPEMNLLPIKIDNSDIDIIRADLPEPPSERRKRYKRDYSLSDDQASRLTAECGISNFFDECIALGAPPAKTATFILEELIKYATDGGTIEFPQPKVAEIVGLWELGKISFATAKRVAKAVIQEGANPESYIHENRLLHLCDENELRRMLVCAMENDSRPLEAYRSGKRSAIGAYVGAVMKISGGSANAETVQKILKEMIGEK